MSSVLPQQNNQNTTSASCATSQNQAINPSPCMEMDKCQLSELIHNKNTLTLEELENLRKQIESQQQIQMTIKNNNPYKVHIQCKHFKSKKCTFQITFKAINTPNSIIAQPVSSCPSEQNINSTGSTATPNLSLLSKQNSTIQSSPSSSNKKGISEKQSNSSQNEENTQNSGNSDNSTSQISQSNLAKGNTTPQQKKTEMKEELPIKQENIKKEENNDKYQQKIEDENNESFLNMIDEQQMSSNHYSNMSPSISPFVFNITSSNQDLNCISLNDAQGEASISQKQQQPASKSINNAISEENTAAIDEESTKVEEQEDNEDDEEFTHSFSQDGCNNENILFKLSNCRLQHRNHPVMSDEEYKIHLAKRWLEGHSEKIENIYEDIREKKGASFKITPKIIKKCLLDTYDIDIYAKCTDKTHKKFLKKKLDNLMKAIRQKERSSQKNTNNNTSTTTEIKPKSSSNQIRALSKNTLNSQKNMSQQQPVQQPESSPSSDQEVKKEEITSDITEQEQSMQIESVAAEVKIEEEVNNENQIQQQQQQQQQIQQQPKIYKEEWESFLEFDDIYRLQPAH